ncbi:pyridoxamine 5'-phosphate oxidase [Pseudomonas fluorescens]|uniref:pyridoxamine 5'-phosphate oxidase n=1 Tax=Pseudomonas fluorescens TaxID=294 RepID=UPI00125B8FCC|nr:pyridoxamine 5'-phosphate oxidase [Pseudomonas fluorescens]VVO15045.1 Pyridoxine/pyridoxamine 5'-phosphate oxidase [Pseudomonas fluorescens]
MPLSLAQLRRNYTLYGLRDENAQADPLVLFGQWLGQARKTEVPPAEANSMALATVDSQGHAHCRILLLKGFSAEGFIFFGHYHSAKGQELASNPHAAMTFFWPGLERQVRIEGPVVQARAQLSDDYFDARPVASQLGAWASPQSQPLAHRSGLESRLREVTQRFAGRQPPRPDNWGGYCLQPRRIEFWQGRPDRLHDRLDYRLHDGHWQCTRLAP